MYTSIVIVSSQLNGFSEYNITLIILFNINFCFHTLKWLQVLLFNPNYSIQRYHSCALGSIKHNSFVYILLNDHTVLFLKVQFSINHFLAHSLNVKQFYLTHREDTICAITPGQSGPRNNVNEGVLHIPKSSKTGASPSDYFKSYQGHSLGVESLTPQQSAFSTAPTDWVLFAFSGGISGTKLKLMNTFISKNIQLFCSYIFYFQSP